MPFSSLKLHPSLLKGVKELGFTRPTPIQEAAIPPALEGRDILACAMTGSGKTAAFILPIIHQLIDRPRGTTRALVLTPTRELAAQIHEDLKDLAVHTPISGAAVFGGVGMGPQEHAFRTGADVIIATPGRLLDHFRQPYAKLAGLEYLVLDEADRMLDMGFLPDIKKVLRHLPPKRQTFFFSATMPAPIGVLAKEMLKTPFTINVERQAAPAVGITQAVYPVAQELKGALFVALLKRGEMKEALVFTRTKHRANRLADYLVKQGIKAARIHGNRSQAQRTDALAGFKDGRYRVLVATDIAARGIDIEELGHVVNFDVPLASEDYIHRVGRTARASATGDAFTFVSPQEESELRNIERAVGKRLPRVTVPDFDYSAKPEGQLEIPLAERIAVIRAKKAEDRARAKAKEAGVRRAAVPVADGQAGARAAVVVVGVAGVGAAAAGAAAVGCLAAARRVEVAVAIAAAERALVVMLLCLPARPMAAQQQAWVIGPQAKLDVRQLWAASLSVRREQVACLGGLIRRDTVLVSRLKPVPEPSDSLTASAQLSLATCAPPEWIGTLHSHVRSTDDVAPASRFSPGDRAVMSAWTTRWGGQGAFCLVYSERNMHCEVYPPRRNPPATGDPN